MGQNQSFAATWTLFAFLAGALPAQVAQVRHAPTLNGRVEGSIQQMSAENVTFNSGAVVMTADAGEERNFNMSSIVIRGNAEPWLSPPLRNDKKWRHSDLRDVAYPYVRGLYKRISTLGNLGTAAP